MIIGLLNWMPGNIIWQKYDWRILADFPKIARQTIDGGYIVGGNSASYVSGDKTEISYGSRDCWIIKLMQLEYSMAKCNWWQYG
ncbi:MAG: hypothetical protein IPL12_00420 [Bacteroidetes bacterium]|nr:hypothetical protein [Bacteroidota bacterium]